MRGKRFEPYDDVLDAVIFSGNSISVHVHPSGWYRLQNEAVRRGCMWYDSERPKLAGRRIVIDPSIPRDEARICGLDEQVIQTVNLGAEVQP